MEGVGLCSYLLIGFWYEKGFCCQRREEGLRGQRVGDFGFISECSSFSPVLENTGYIH